MTDAQRATWSLYAGVAAVALAILVMALTALSVTCVHGEPNSNTILGPGHAPWPEAAALLLLVAAIIAIIIGLQVTLHRGTDPRIHRRAVWGLVLGAISVPCCGPLSVAAGGFIGVAAQNCF
jgi:succinate dehydrogenase hydrophobic anchor subunit